MADQPSGLRKLSEIARSIFALSRQSQLNPCEPLFGSQPPFLHLVFIRLTKLGGFQLSNGLLVIAGCGEGIIFYFNQCLEPFLGLYPCWWREDALPTHNPNGETHSGVHAMIEKPRAILHELAKKAAEDAWRNAGVAPQLLFAPILWALEAAHDAGVLEVQTVGNEADHD